MDVAETLFAGSGELAALMREKRWADTQLGPPETWPQSLRTVVRIMLTSRYAMWMGWGDRLSFFYNDAYRPTLGVKHEWALASPASKVWEEIWPAIGPRIESVLSRGEATWDEGLLLLLERSGYPEETYHTFSYSPLPDDTGTVRGMLCVVTEETERVLGERRLALLRDFAARLAQTKNTREVFAAFEGCAEGDARDLPFTLLYLFDEDERHARLVSFTGIDAGHPAALQTVDLLSGSPAWPLSATLSSSESAVPFDLDEHGKPFPSGPWDKPPRKALALSVAQQGQSRPLGMLITGLNPHRALDDGYRSFLGLLVGQLAAGLANVRAYEEERRRAEALAEIDRAKTTFFSNVSHEFRTPLTLMLGPVEDLLRDATLPAGEHEKVVLVHRNGLRLLKLVNSLLDFSRLEAGRVQANYAPVDLARLTTELTSVFRSAMEKAKLSFVVECSPINEPVYVDADMWEKIVLNLLSNAFKFTLEGEVLVQQRKVGDHVELTVKDSGCGVPKAEVAHLFERFHRVEGTKGRTHEGTGIGLAMVMELAKLHGGNVGAESELGVGTTFKVTIPLGSAHLPKERIFAENTRRAGSLGLHSFVEEAARWLPDDAPSGRHGSAETSPATLEDNGSFGAITGSTPAPALDTSGVRARVILADDNADMRQYVARLLSHRYDVEVVSDGQRALDAARRETPALILSDVMMPNLDGFGLLRAVRADPALATVPVILLSARAGEEATVEGMVAGADDYLVKPFNARELLARVDGQIERKRFERELQEADVRLRFALDAGELVAWEWDIDRGVTRRSGEACIRYGLSTSDSPDFYERVHHEDRQQVAMAVARALRDDSEYVAEFRLEAPNGEIYWVHDRGRIARDEAGRATLMSGIMLDITERKRAEEQRDHLLGVERRAREEAERVNRMKDEFLATLSHELRTPLNAILGWAQILRNHGSDQNTLGKAVATIERNAVAQAQLVEDLLDMNRIVSGKVRLNVRRITVGTILEQAVESVRPAAEAKGIRLLSLATTSVEVSGDGDRLQQVFWNLLANAIKFTPKGGKVQVTLERVGSDACVTISDSGEGIGPEFLPFIFERFRQADGSTTRRHGGLGLGLSIVKHLVELHGGKVHAESGGRGQGSTFVVRLPLAAASRVEDVVEPHRRSAPPPEDDASLPSLHGITVLLVDDDADARELVGHILRTSGADVVIAQSVDEALSALHRTSPSLIVSDIGMPGEDGYEFIRKVRSQPPERGGRVPAVALTALARSEDRQRAMRAGYQLHISKPVDASELLTICASLTQRLQS